MLGDMLCASGPRIYRQEGLLVAPLWPNGHWQKSLADGVLLCLAVALGQRIDSLQTDLNFDSAGE